MDKLNIYIYTKISNITSKINFLYIIIVIFHQYLIDLNIN